MPTTRSALSKSTSGGRRRLKDWGKKSDRLCIDQSSEYDTVREKILVSLNGFQIPSFSYIILLTGQAGLLLFNSVILSWSDTRAIL